MSSNAPGKRGADPLDCGELFLTCMHDFVDIPERLHERRPFLFSHALDLVQYRLQIALAVQTSEVGNGKAVRLVTNALQRLERVVATVDDNGLVLPRHEHLLLALCKRYKVDPLYVRRKSPLRQRVDPCRRQ